MEDSMANIRKLISQKASYQPQTNIQLQLTLNLKSGKLKQEKYVANDVIQPSQPPKENAKMNVTQQFQNSQQIAFQKHIASKQNQNTNNKNDFVVLIQKEENFIDKFNRQMRKQYGHFYETTSDESQTQENSQFQQKHVEKKNQQPTCAQKSLKRLSIVMILAILIGASITVASIVIPIMKKIQILQIFQNVLNLFSNQLDGNDAQTMAILLLTGLLFLALFILIFAVYLCCCCYFKCDSKIVCRALCSQKH